MTAMGQKQPIWIEKTKTKKQKKKQTKKNRKK